MSVAMSVAMKSAKGCDIDLLCSKRVQQLAI